MFQFSQYWLQFIILLLLLSLIERSKMKNTQNIKTFNISKYFFRIAYLMSSLSEYENTNS